MKKYHYNWKLSTIIISLFFLHCKAAPILFDYSTYGSIQQAIDTANEYDTIIIPYGIYSKFSGESFPINLNKPITLKAADSLIKPILQGDQAHTVLLISSGGVTLEGFTIKDGLGSEGINLMDGGGICVFVGPNETRNVEIKNCIIEHNSCPWDETYDGSGGGIYCGGTYCTCFETLISNCVIRNNSVRGLGGGVMCALLSNVTIDDNTLIENNSAEDQGGGIYIDVYGVCKLYDTIIENNQCIGSPGGRGGGLACESFAVFTAENCDFEGNSATHFGGGIYSRGSVLRDKGICDISQSFPYLLNCNLFRNDAESGGGVYVSNSGVLGIYNTKFYWNDASSNGGGIYVAGGSTGGTINIGPDLNSNSSNCLLEGNECGNLGGGVYLAANSSANFDSVTIVGNSSLYDGGAVYLGADANCALNNCLVDYNNSARGNGGGFRAVESSTLDLTHCSVVGNFAPDNRSGLYIDPNVTLNIHDSILWRNAGGSIEDNGAAVNITTSLNEDGANPANGVIDGDPNYAGWGTAETIDVNASFDLQQALNGFDFTLAANSPCIGLAGDGSNLGADTGTGGTAGNTTVKLNISAGSYDIRGRNIIFTKGIQGAGPLDTVITNSVFGYNEDTYIKDLQITGEDIFGGIVIRKNIDITNCYINDNNANADGGGIYLTHGTCNITDSQISYNESSGEGGGIYAWAGTTLSVKNSNIESNKTELDRYDGGGIYLNPDTIASITDNSNINYNSALNGGAVFVSGTLEVSDANFVSNIATEGGSIYVNNIADVKIAKSSLSSNTAITASEGGGGAIMCLGKTQINNTLFKGNSAVYADAGAIFVKEPSDLHCQNCSFEQNSAKDEGGAVRIFDKEIEALFSECEFIENTSIYAGAIYCDPYTKSVFDNCNFSKNTARARGGAVLTRRSQTTFNQCIFSDNTANDGGTGFISENNDSSLFKGCIVQNSTANNNGGAFLLMYGQVNATFNHVKIIDCNAGNLGGGFYLEDYASPNLYEVLITDCYAKNGGGIYAGENSNGVFTGCRFINNQALDDVLSADGGGAYFTVNAAGSFRDCQFQNNYAQDDGGGIGIADHANIDVNNTLFFDNLAENAGGAAHFTTESKGYFINCTVASNQANYSNGGGIYLEDKSTVNIDSSIVYDNIPDGIRSDADPNVINSCTQKLWPGTGNIIVDPLFVSGAGGSYYLSQTAAGQSFNSPCIDAGSVTALVRGLDTMTTRTDRIWDANTVDMGYHYYGTIGDLDFDGKVDFADFAILASQWLTVPSVPSADIAPAETDNVVDWQDLMILIDHWLWLDYYHICDINNNNKVGLDDFAILASQWQKAPQNPSADIAPIGGDNIVDSRDLMFFVDNWLWSNEDRTYAPPSQSHKLIWSGGPYTLDGVDDYIILPEGIMKNCFDFTIAAWVWIDTRNAWERIFDFGTGTNNYMFLTVQSNTNTLHYAITTGGGEQQINGPNPLPTGSWQHVAVTLSITTCKLYLNGDKIASSPITLAPYLLGTTNQNYIGKSQWSNPYLDGQVHDFRIYNYALSKNEITVLSASHP
jgi:predicted outer membrane repeat protein